VPPLNTLITSGIEINYDPVKTIVINLSLRLFSFRPHGSRLHFGFQKVEHATELSINVFAQEPGRRAASHSRTTSTGARLLASTS
jgi:hypothetical protein